MTATVVIENITTKDTTSPATTAETDEPLEEDSSPEAKEERIIYGVIEYNYTVPLTQQFESLI